MRSATCSAIVESFPNPDTSVPRSFTTTRAPRSARSSTYARPSPRPAPVTTATFPSKEIRSGISPSSSAKILTSSQAANTATPRGPQLSLEPTRPRLVPPIRRVAAAWLGLRLRHLAEGDDDRGSPHAADRLQDGGGNV